MKEKKWIMKKNYENFDGWSVGSRLLVVLYPPHTESYETFKLLPSNWRA